MENFKEIFVCDFTSTARVKSSSIVKTSSVLTTVWDFLSHYLITINDFFGEIFLRFLSFQIRHLLYSEHLMQSWKNYFHVKGKLPSVGQEVSITESFTPMVTLSKSFPLGS